MRLRILPTCWAGCCSLKRRGRLAFTFAEVLAALVFMAIVIPVAMQGLQIANRAGVVAQRKSIAVQLGEKLLNELIVTDNWRTTGQSGNFGNYWRNYHWRLRNEAWSEDRMRLVTMEVTYLVQNQEYTVHLSTLLNEAEQ